MRKGVVLLMRGKSWGGGNVSEMAGWDRDSMSMSCDRARPPVVLRTITRLSSHIVRHGDEGRP